MHKNEGWRGTRLARWTVVRTVLVLGTYLTMALVTSWFPRWLLTPMAGALSVGVLTTLSEEPLSINVVHPTVSRQCPTLSESINPTPASLSRVLVSYVPIRSFFVLVPVPAIRQKHRPLLSTVVTSLCIRRLVLFGRTAIGRNAIIVQGTFVGTLILP